ncbi:MAG: hypothetical protein D4R82_01315 [Dehalococcoidia bacterium]|nr:MAG: hypothetical protein D4R82_01315 [Dehalococcoidia bacterium]
MNNFSFSVPIQSLKDKLMSAILHSSEFKEALRDASGEIVREAYVAANEATIEGVFDRVLYAILRDVGVKFHPEKEITIDTVRHIGKGRADSRIGAVIIEYKHRSKLQRLADIAKAKEQLSDYICPLSEQFNREIIGFLTDGIHIYEIRGLKGSIYSISGEAEISSVSLLNLIRCVFLLGQAALSPANLIRDFCGSHYDGVLFHVARMLSTILTSKSTLKTDMLRSEWEEIFRLAHDDQSQQRRIQERREKLSEIFQEPLEDAAAEYRALFSLHTSYAIILKLMAFRVVSDIQFGSPIQDYKSLTVAESEVLRPFCNKLEDGEIFRDLGILNLLEGDFFSWYCDEEQWDDELAAVLRDILVILSRYEDVTDIFSSTDVIELFRELYEAAVPQIVRASFGEFYTPFWLARHVLESSELKANWRALDPCCGSGTFVIAAISQIRKDKKDLDGEALLTEILSRVAAIDLNPLAVLTTRIHYFIHIADLLPPSFKCLVIPVYLGDSSYIPEIVNESGVKCLKYQLHTHMDPINVVMPLSLIENTTEFAQLMYKYERLVRNKDGNNASALLVESIRTEDKTQPIIEKILELTKQLIALEKDKRNGIWARIITNFLTTACLQPFSNVIGNPPWIDWKNLPSSYREKIKAICVDKGLFSGAGRTGGINLNICALITHVACNWLSYHGKLAFLLPKELANQPSYEGWLRSVGGSNRDILEFRDWSTAGHPFYPVTEDFMTFVIGPKVKEEEKVNITPVTKYSKKSQCRTKAREWKSIEEAMSNLNIREMCAGQITPNSSAYTFADNPSQLHRFSKILGECAYIGREGIEFYPQEMLIFHYDAPGPKPGTVWLRNIQVSKSKYHIPSQRVLLETKFLNPLVKGRGIEYFRYNNDNLIVPFPYDSSNPTRPLDRKELEDESPLLLSYYEKYREIIEMQTEFSDRIRGPNAGEYYGLARTGPYSFQNVYVAFRDNTKWRAAVVTKDIMPWGDVKRFVFQNHAVSICERKYGSGYINEDEAYYISAILNAKIVEEYIYASQDSRSFRIRPPIFLPQYDETKDAHRRLAELSREAQAASENIDRIRSKIDEIYLGICQENPSLTKQMPLNLR